MVDEEKGRGGGGAKPPRSRLGPPPSRRPGGALTEIRTPRRPGAAAGTEHRPPAPAPTPEPETPAPEDIGFDEGGEPTLVSPGLEELERRLSETDGAEPPPDGGGETGTQGADPAEGESPASESAEDAGPVADGEPAPDDEPQAEPEPERSPESVAPRSSTLVFDGAALEETLRRPAEQDAVDEEVDPQGPDDDLEASGAAAEADGARPPVPTGVFEAVSVELPTGPDEEMPADPSPAEAPATLPVAQEPWEEAGGEDAESGPSRSGTLVFSPAAIVELTGDLLEIDEELDGEAPEDAERGEAPAPGEVREPEVAARAPEPSADRSEAEPRTSVSTSEPEPEPEPPWRPPVEQGSPREAPTAVDMPALIDPGRFWPSASAKAEKQERPVAHGTMAFDPGSNQDATTSPGAIVDVATGGPSTSPDLETVSPEAPSGDAPGPEDAPSRHATLLFDPSQAAAASLGKEEPRTKTVAFDAKEFEAVRARAAELQGESDAGGQARGGASERSEEAESPPAGLEGASFGATIPSFAGVEIDDLDPSRGPTGASRPFELEESGEEGGPTTLEPALADAAQGADEGPTLDKRSTMHTLDAAWARPGVRDAETKVIPTVTGSDPAWTGEPAGLGGGAKPKVPVAEIDERAARGPVGPATARPQKKLVPRTAATTLPEPADEEPEVGPVLPPGPAAATSFLRAMVVLGLFVLLTAFAVPTVVGDGLAVPWKTVADPQSISFLCAVFFGLNLLLAIVPMPLVWRSLVLGLSGVAALEFGRILFVDAGLRFVFRGQPAIAAVFAGGILPAILGTLAAITLPAGLYARGRFPASIAARVTVVLGLALGLFALLGWQALPGGGGRMPVLELVDAAFGGSSLQGDRLASMALLLSAMMLPLSLLAFLGKRRTGLVTLWAFIYSAGLIVALVIEAVHVGHLEQWREVLEPTKLALFMAVGLLLAPPAVGYFIGSVGAHPRDIRS